MSSVKWTKQLVLEEAQKYQNVKAWQNNNMSSYNRAIKQCWLKEATKHMIPLRKKWTREDVLKDAKNYTTRTEWRHKSNVAAKKAAREGWFQEATTHMVGTPPGYWTYERIKSEAAKHSTVKEWRISSGGSYQAAFKRGILNEFTQTMHRPEVWNLKWNQRTLEEEAIKHSTKKDWRNENPSSYAIAWRQGISDEISSHMTEIRHPSGYWIKERVLEDAFQYNTRSQWKYAKENGAYCAAMRYGWLDEATRHMVRFAKKSNVIYIWKVKDKTLKLENLYKIGVTSSHLGFQRIRKVSKEMGVEYSILSYVKTENAVAIEKHLLTLGKRPKLNNTNIDGYSEFRVLSDKELKRAFILLDELKIPDF